MGVGLWAGLSGVEGDWGLSCRGAGFAVGRPRGPCWVSGREDVVLAGVGMVVGAAGGIKVFTVEAERVEKV